MLSIPVKIKDVSPSTPKNSESDVCTQILLTLRFWSMDDESERWTGAERVPCSTAFARQDKQTNKYVHTPTHTHIFNLFLTFLGGASFRSSKISFKGGASLLSTSRSLVQEFPTRVMLRPCGWTAMLLERP